MTVAEIADHAARKFTPTEFDRLAAAGMFDGQTVELMDGDIILHTAGELEKRRFNRTEYYQMAELDIFTGPRVELIDGEILVMSPQTDPHARTIAIINSFFIRNLPEHYCVRIQLPLAVDATSEPEPDLAVVDEDPRILRGHPTSALLAIEVAYYSIAFDRRKANLYAAAGVVEYWILNLRDRRLELHRNPVPDAMAQFGHRYAEQRTLSTFEKVAPLALGMPEIPIARLFPNG